MAAGVDAERSHGIAERIKGNRHERELTVLARRQIDLATQLVVEMQSLVQAGGAVAHGVILSFTALNFGRNLLLFELRQGLLQLQLALALRGQFDPDAQHMARCGAVVARDADPVDAELTPLPVALDALLADRAGHVCQRSLLGGPDRCRLGRLHQIGIAGTQKRLRLAIEQCRHARVRVDIGARRDLLDAHQDIHPVEHFQEPAGQARFRGAQRDGQRTACLAAVCLG